MNWSTYDNKQLIKAFKATNDPVVLQSLLDDLLTDSEIAICVTRLKAAHLIYAGAPYSEIRKITSLSPSTIARISKQLQNPQSGFKTIIRKMNPHGQRYFD